MAEKNQKPYKEEKIKYISGLRTVTIFPGDREVAECLFFNYSSGGLLYKKLKPEDFN